MTRSRTRAWRPGESNLRFLARNNTLRRYPSARQAIIPVTHTTSERAREPRGDEDDVEDEETVAATAGEGGASASSTAAHSVVELFYAPKVFSLKGSFDAWLATGEDLWVYTTTRREDMLCVLKHSIHAIFTILSAAAGKPDGSAGFHVRPLTSWSVLMYAAEFGFHKIDFWGGGRRRLPASGAGEGGQRAAASCSVHEDGVHILELQGRQSPRSGVKRPTRGGCRPLHWRCALQPIVPVGGGVAPVPRPPSAVPPSRFLGYFQAIWGRHSVVPHRNRSLRRGMAGRGPGDTFIRLGWPVPRLRRRESSSHGQVPGLCITVMMQSHEFRMGLAPGAVRRDQCQHGMVRKTADRPRRPRLIRTPGFVRIAGNLATQIDS